MNVAEWKKDIEKNAGASAGPSLEQIA
jgi:hypothetical protein